MERVSPVLRDHALGDLSPEQFKESAQYLSDWLADYLGPDSRPEPVLSRVKPGEIRATQTPNPPETGQDPMEILREFREHLTAGLTHWNSPRFFAYFSISASMPGVLADFLSAGLNQQAMLWRTSPVTTELEGLTLDWLRQGLGLPGQYTGVIYDTASVSTLHALATARDVTLPDVRSKGHAGRQLVVYCSEHTHSSIDKAVLMLGLGWDNLRKIPCDENLSMLPQKLAEQIAKDKAAGLFPCAVVATVGTTSTAAVDPVDAIAEVCSQENVWLHVDAAYGGVTALLEECRPHFKGWEKADSIVLNPHKWLFTPFDLSVLYMQDMDKLKRAFSLTPEYLKNAEEGQVMNLMDTGVQLGRRFRSLKLWMIFRCFGMEGIRERLRYHLDLARHLGGLIERSDDFEMALPVSMSLVCFRWKGHSDDQQLELMERLNQTGRFFISHTKIRGRVLLRCAIGHIRTNVGDIDAFFEELKSFV
jgi:aromatic-L-amino-acid/L-tryptophan decarboxylase